MTGDYPSWSSQREGRMMALTRMDVGRYDTREEAEQMLRRLESMPTTIGRDFRVEGPEDGPAPPADEPAADGGGEQTAAAGEPL